MKIRQSYEDVVGGQIHWNLIVADHLGMTVDQDLNGLIYLDVGLDCEAIEASIGKSSGTLLCRHILVLGVAFSSKSVTMPNIAEKSIRQATYLVLTLFALPIRGVQHAWT